MKWRLHLIMTRVSPSLFHTIYALVENFLGSEWSAGSSGTWNGLQFKFLLPLGRGFRDQVWRHTGRDLNKPHFSLDLYNIHFRCFKKYDFCPLLDAFPKKKKRYCQHVRQKTESYLRFTWIKIWPNSRWNTSSARVSIHRVCFTVLSHYVGLSR